MKRPSAIVHMALWGGVTGWITAAGMLLILNISDIGGKDVMSASALFGGISGTFLGFIAGILIHSLLNNTSRQGYEELTRDAEELVGTLTFFGMIVMLFSFRIPFGISLLYVTLIPMMLIFGTGRYFAKIKAIYPDIQAGLKAKNSDKVSRIIQKLEDKPKNPLAEEKVEAKKKTKG